MNDRIPTRPGRVKLTKDDGSVFYAVMERADEPTQEGTPLNKATLFNSDNSARFGAETPAEGFARLGQILTATFPVNGWKANGNWQENRVNVSGMKAAYNPFLDVVITSAATAEDERAAFGCIIECETFDGYVIARALDVPDISINVRFLGV